MTDLSDAKRLRRYAHFAYLTDLREQLGMCYGSEETCVMMYNMVKREKPAVVVELGTGLGVTAAWIGAAMKENGFGHLYTFDNGSGFPINRTKYMEPGLTGDLAPLGACEDIGQLVNAISESIGTREYVTFAVADFNLPDTDWLRETILAHCQTDVMPGIDILFSDFQHSAGVTAKIVGTFLPHMSDVSSILIDSASTHMPSHYLLEQVRTMLDMGKVPKEFLDLQKSQEDRRKLEQIVAQSRFQLIHLVERSMRRQNSTAWLRIERNSLLPALAMCVH